MPKKGHRVLQVIDSLSVGGAERVAVNLANHLAVDHFSALCVTREEGPLRNQIQSDLPYCFLKKSHAFDIIALLRLVNFVKKHDINIIHAHSSSIFWVVAIKLFTKVHCIWHDHYGLSEQLDRRPKTLLIIFRSWIDFVFAVNQKLESFAVRELRFAKRKVMYLPNFPSLNVRPPGPSASDQEIKIACLANLRPQKDHITLLEAFKMVHAQKPDTKLCLIGKSFDDDYCRMILNRVESMDGVSFLGVRTDIGSLLPKFDLGVLSSISEGLPMCILEFGICGVAVISTNVGQCAELFPNMEYLVPPKEPSILAERILSFLNRGVLKEKSEKFCLHIQKNYSLKTSLSAVKKVYADLLTN